MKQKASVSHDEVMVRKLRISQAFAAEYLKAAMEDTEEPQALLVALRHLAEARGGIAKIAKAAGIERESLYRALSPRESAALHARRSDESPGLDAHSRGVLSDPSLTTCNSRGDPHSISAG